MDRTTEWFAGSREYWCKVASTIEGMLGGYDSLSAVDERDSLKFIQSNVPAELCSLALDCGAGIGRVSKNVLLRLFDKVSLLDCNNAFLEKAAKTILAERIHQIHNCKIQEIPAIAKESPLTYDLIWFQWVLCYVDDQQLIQILEAAKTMLRHAGYIGVKENILRSGDLEYDHEDHSVIRSDAGFKRIFAQAGFRLVSVASQRNFPSTLYPVKMYLLCPE